MQENININKLLFTVESSEVLTYQNVKLYWCGKRVSRNQESANLLSEFEVHKGPAHAGTIILVIP